MTLSPEARAMRVTDAILDLVMVDGENVSASVLHPAQDIIAKAIREACNEKLEEAAQRAMETSQAHAEGWRENPSKYGCGGAVAASNTGFFIIQAIRSLKDTTP